MVPCLLLRLPVVPVRMDAGLLCRCFGGLVDWYFGTLVGLYHTGPDVSRGNVVKDRALAVGVNPGRDARLVPEAGIWNREETGHRRRVSQAREMRCAGSRTYAIALPPGQGSLRRADGGMEVRTYGRLAWTRAFAASGARLTRPAQAARVASASWSMLAFCRSGSRPPTSMHTRPSVH